MNDNQWHHIAATYDGGIMKMYINGHLNSEVTNTVGHSSNNDSLLIGNFVYNYNDAHGNEPNILNGLMDDVRIYEHALSEDEIQELYIMP